MEEPKKVWRHRITLYLDTQADLGDADVSHVSDALAKVAEESTTQIIGGTAKVTNWETNWTTYGQPEEESYVKARDEST